METYRISDGQTEAELECFQPWLAQINPESPAAPQLGDAFVFKKKNVNIEDPFINSLSTLNLM